MIRWLALLCCWLAHATSAQQVAAVLTWQQDTMALGRPVVATLIITHPTGLQVRVADKKADLQPWELVEKKQYYPDSQRDSIVYLLRSWMPAAQQELRLQYSYLHNGRLKKDSTNRASIALNSRLPQQADLAYKQDNTLIQASEYKQDEADNFEYWLILQIVVLVLLVLGFIFRKKLYRAWLRYRLRRSYTRLLLQLHQLAPLLQHDPATYVQRLCSLWMAYMADAQLPTLTPAELKRWSAQQPVPDAHDVLYHLALAAEQAAYGRWVPATAELERLTSQLEAYLTQVYLHRRHAV